MVLALTSCAGLPPRGHMMIVKDDQALPTPSPDTAIIVFLSSRSSLKIFDVTSEDPRLVGITAFDQKIAYEVSAGEHYFSLLMSDRFLSAKVSGGKTYFVMARETVASSTVGLATVLFVNAFAGSPGIGELIPVRIGGEGDYQLNSEGIQKMLKEDKFAEVTSDAQEYYSKELWIKNVKKARQKYLPKFKDMPADDLLRFTLNPEDGIDKYDSNQITRITQDFKTEHDTAQPSINKQTEIPTSAAENSNPDPDSKPAPVTVPVAVAEPQRKPEPVSSTSPSNTRELEALMALRDDGIISEDEFQEQKIKILAKKQRAQTSVQSNPRIEEVGQAETGYIAGDPSDENHNPSIPGDLRNQRSQVSEKPVNESSAVDKGDSKQPGGNQNDSSKVNKTEWVRDVGGRKLYCVRTAGQTICQ